MNVLSASNPFNFQWLVELFCIKNHRSGSATFSVPKANAIIAGFSHLPISPWTCAFSEPFPICGIAFYAKAVFVCIPFAEHIRAFTAAGQKYERIGFSNILNTHFQICFCCLVILIISAPCNNDSLNHRIPSLNIYLYKYTFNQENCQFRIPLIKWIQRCKAV